MSVPIHARLLWAGAIPGTLYVTNHRVLWELTVSSEPLPTLEGGTAIDVPDFIALPIHSVDSLRLGKKGQALPQPGVPAGTTVDVLVKYAAHPGLRLFLADAGATQLVTALNGATLSPPSRPNDLRADVSRSLALTRGAVIEVAPGAGPAARMSAVATPEIDEESALASDGAVDGAAGAADAPAAAEASAGGWQVAEAEEDLADELARLGVGQPTSRWRICRRNEAFELCPSYPRLLAVPSAISDDEIAKAADFRSGRRLPVLCWKDPSGSAAICRSSQPKVGPMMARSAQDEALLQVSPLRATRAASPASASSPASPAPRPGAAEQPQPQTPNPKPKPHPSATPQPRVQD